MIRPGRDVLVTMKRMLWIGVALSLLLACAESSDDSTDDEDDLAGETPPPPVSEPSDSGSGPDPEPPPETTEQSVSECSVADDMSDRERLAQLLVVGVDPADPEEVSATVRKHQVGGIFVGEKATDLFLDDALDRVQEEARIPVSVAVDEEGGRVQRIQELDGPLPSAREMAETLTPEQVRDLAAERGQALREHGVTVDHAPDVDLDDGAADGAIGDRSYSADPAVAREYALAFAHGLEDAGIQPAIKHFPGHGSAVGDSHAGLISTPPLSQLRNNDLLPYEDIQEYGDDVGVLVGHLDVPGLTDGDPATTSPAAYELLRDEFRFDGPALTDDLGAMRAITDRYPLPEAVLAALKAGADQPLWSSGGQVGDVLDHLEQALAEGELQDERVREALDRVLRAKDACDE